MAWVGNWEGGRIWRAKDGRAGHSDGLIRSRRHDME
jgi:hypothetical protein